VLQARREAAERDINHRAAALESMTKRCTEHSLELSTAGAQISELQEQNRTYEKQLEQERVTAAEAQVACTEMEETLNKLHRKHEEELDLLGVSLSQLSLTVLVPVKVMLVDQMNNRQSFLLAYKPSILLTKSFLFDLNLCRVLRRCNMLSHRQPWPASLTLLRPRWRRRKMISVDYKLRSQH
jgi:hypothetical protein